MKQKHLTPKKIKNLVKKALKDKPKWEPSKGKTYLKDLEPGDFFTTYSMVGILIECITNAKVIITDSGNNQGPNRPTGNLRNHHHPQPGCRSPLCGQCKRYVRRKNPRIWNFRSSLQGT